MTGNYLHCPFCCRQKLGSVEALRDHLLFFTYKPVQCPVCSESITGLQPLVRHLDSHLENSAATTSIYPLPLYSREASLELNDNAACLKSKYPQSASLLQLGALSIDQSSSNENETNNQIDPNDLHNFSTCVRNEWNGYNSDIEVCENNFSNSQNTAQFGAKPISNSSLPLLSVNGPHINTDCELTGQSHEVTSKPVLQENTPLRFYVCSTCGEKIMSQDLYFKHLQLHSQPLSTSSRVENTFEDMTTLEEDRISPTLHFNCASVEESSSNLKSPLNGAVATDFSNQNISYVYEDNLPDDAGREKSLSSFVSEENLITDCSFELPSTESLNSPHSQNEETVYIHKKFHHDYKTTNNDNRDIAKDEISFFENKVKDAYIPAMQSVLISRLNSSISSHKFHSEAEKPSSLFYKSSNKEIYCTENEELISNETIYISKLSTEEPVGTNQITNCTAAVIDENREETFSVQSENIENVDSDSITDHSLVEFINDSNDQSADDITTMNHLEHSSNDIEQGSNDYKTQTNLRSVPKCNICSKVFATKSNYRRHMSEKHAPDSIYVCKECKKKFNSWRSLMNHFGTHKKNKSYQCKLCDHRCYTKAGIRTHKFEVHGPAAKDSQNNFKCAECGEKFRRKFNLDRHKKRKHSNAEVICDICDKVCSCIESLNDHLKNHQESSESHLKCDVCNVNFKSKYAYKRHMTNAHPDSSTNKISESSSVNHFEISSQKSMQSFNLERLNKCDTTVKVPADNCTMMQEESLDSSSKNLLNLSFPIEAVSALHSKQQTHSVKILSSSKCHICKKSFSRSDSLKLHLKSVHSKDKPFSCDICDVKFARKSYLLTHKDKHNSSPTHACSVCTKKFKFKVSLKHHSCEPNYLLEKKNSDITEVR